MDLLQHVVLYVLSVRIIPEDLLRGQFLEIVPGLQPLQLLRGAGTGIDPRQDIPYFFLVVHVFFGLPVYMTRLKRQRTVSD